MKFNNLIISRQRKTLEINIVKVNLKGSEDVKKLCTGLISSRYVIFKNLCELTIYSLIIYYKLVFKTLSHCVVRIVPMERKSPFFVCFLCLQFGS